MEQNKSAAMMGIAEIGGFLHISLTLASKTIAKLFLEEINNIFNDFPEVDSFTLEAKAGKLICIYSEEFIRVSAKGDFDLGELEHRVNALFTSVPLFILDAAYSAEVESSGEITIEKENYKNG